MENNENVVEWLSGQRTITVSLNDAPRIRKIKKIYQDRPEDFSYFYENQDGSICFKVPAKWLKITPPRSVAREFSEEERAALRERLAAGRKKKGGGENK